MAQSFDGILCCLNNNNKQAICRARQEVLLRLKRLKRGRMNNLTAVGSAGAGMKTDGTGVKTPQPFPFLYFITENKKRERNRWERDIRITETGGNRKV